MPFLLPLKLFLISSNPTLRMCYIRINDSEKKRRLLVTSDITTEGGWNGAVRGPTVPAVGTAFSSRLAHLFLNWRKREELDAQFLNLTCHFLIRYKPVLKY